MRGYLQKIGVAATVALGVLGASVATSGTALARAGGHGGGGGMHVGRAGGGGMHAGRVGGGRAMVARAGHWRGGWRGGHWRGGWRGGWGWRRGWGGGWWGPGFAAGLALGAWPYYGYYGPYAYGGCYRRLVINRYGYRVWRRVCY